MSGACAACLGRAWLLARLAGHLETARSRLDAVLALGDAELIAAVAGRRADAISRERDGFDPDRARRAADRAGLELVCRCAADYPDALRSLDAPPAVLHLAGERRHLAACA